MRPLFQIYTFGRFEIKSCQGDKTVKPLTTKSLALLKLLAASANCCLSTRTIKELLYIDYSPNKASQALDTQIHRLRKQLGNDQAITRQGESVSLDLEYFWIDICIFEAVCARLITPDNAYAIAKQLQGVYLGEYLPNEDSLDVVANRERYRNMYLATLFKCVENLHEQAESAIALCQYALVLEPLSEPLYRKLIAIYLLHGNRDMAEATMAQCRNVLKRYLDCDLSQETLSLLDTPPTPMRISFLK